MDEAPPLTLLPKEEIITENLEIKQDKDIIQLKVKIENEIMSFQILVREPLLIGYSSKYKLNQIKSINKVFAFLKSCKEFLDYLKALAAENQITIKKSDEDKKYLSINFEAKYLLEKILITIKLFPEKLDIGENITYLSQQLLNLKNEIKI